LLPVRLSNTNKETELRYVALSENMPKIRPFRDVETTIGAKEPSTEWIAVHHAVRNGHKADILFLLSRGDGHDATGPTGFPAFTLPSQLMTLI